MPVPRRPLQIKACVLCAQPWTPRTSRQAREKTTCSAACAGRASGQHRVGIRRAQTSDPRGRTCTSCGLFKGWSAFAWTVRGQWRSAWCRACVSAYNRAYRASYGASLQAEKAAKRAARQWARGARRPAYNRWRKTFVALDRKVERSRDCIHLVGAYFRAVRADLGRPDPNQVPHPDDKGDLLLWALQCLAFLLRAHVYLSWEQIGAVLRRDPALVEQWVILVRRRIRQSHWTPLAGHAQELLRCAEQMHPSAQVRRQLRAQRPSDLDLYRTRRRAQDLRERRFG